MVLYILPFLEIKYSQALDKAKQEIKFLVVYLHSDEHESSDEFCETTLASPELVSFFVENDLLFWGGNVNYTEGYQVSVALQCSGFPFLALVSLRPRSSETGGYKMSVIDRLEGLATPEEVKRKISSQISRINPLLGALRFERAEQEASRSLREQQDQAYQQSLMADQEKARRLKEQKEKEAREKDRQNQELERNALNAKYRSLYVSMLKSKLPAEPEQAPGVSRFSIRLVNGQRFIRRFCGDQSVMDLYNYTETIIPADEWVPSTATSEAIQSLPDDYVHKFSFRLTSYPRLVFEPSLDSLKDVNNLWPGANLLVEPVGVE
ncbi:UBX domain-containing protein 10 [Entomophthora muscae]|uniref:UBX domain-containing protein 10 n=1 Tax=Entomophthora muscae TaxID=34485 RepID=A0ACC2T1S3_9FUNG|nr:UBX domain-containing protein 10 [Entomophthora muscae]